VVPEDVHGQPLRQERGGHPARRGAGRRRYLVLQEAAHPYAQQLAARIDHGKAIISGPFPA
jgi:hypothetical protein